MHALSFPVACRPVVKAADDTSNFEEYNLGAMQHFFKLSEAEQAMFEGI